MGELLKKQGAKFEYGTARLEDRAAILADIERVGAGCWASGSAGAGCRQLFGLLLLPCTLCHA